MFRLWDCKIKSNIGNIFKAVVAGPAGPASAGPLFWPNLLSSVSLFSSPEPKAHW